MSDDQRLRKARSIDENVDREQAVQQAVTQFVAELGETTDDADVGIVESAMHALARVEEMETRIEELEAENAHLRSVVDKLEDIGAEKSTKEQKVAAIVTYADNVAESEEKDAVTVRPTTITGVVNVSRRYAYDLVDDIIQRYDWAHDPTEIEQYGSLEKDEARKGVLVDIEGVHGDAAPVNKFTTQFTAEGAAD